MKLAQAAAIAGLTALAAPAFAGHGTDYSDQVSACTADGQEVGAYVEVGGTPVEGVDVAATLTQMLNTIINGQTVDAIDAEDSNAFYARVESAMQTADEALQATGDTSGVGNGVYLDGLYLTGNSCTPG